MKERSILDEICLKKRAELDAQKAETPFEKMLEAALGAPQRASFKRAITAPGAAANVIAELKKASPSRGLIRADFDAPSLAKALEGAGAAALSVLTERNYFLGGEENLAAAAREVSIPLLCKDFIFDEYQICRAKARGASAVLLIVRMLGAGRLRELLEFAKSLSLDALCEAHTSEEIRAAAAAGADIIGVNCRDLKTFATDFSLTEKLLAEIPEGVAAVAESAIESAQMLERARAAGARAALVGTSLMSAPDPAAALKRLLGK